MSHHIGREIPEEVAARTDRENEFPADMWRKFGEAGYILFYRGLRTGVYGLSASWASQQTKTMEV